MAFRTSLCSPHSFEVGKPRQLLFYQQAPPTPGWRWRQEGLKEGRQHPQASSRPRPSLCRASPEAITAQLGTPAWDHCLGLQGWDISTCSFRSVPFTDVSITPPGCATSSCREQTSLQNTECLPRNHPQEPGQARDEVSFDAAGLFTHGYPAPLGAEGAEQCRLWLGSACQASPAAPNPSGPSPFPLPRAYSTPSPIFLCPRCSSSYFFSVTYCSVPAARILPSLCAHAAGLEEAAWADGSSPRLSSISASLPAAACLRPCVRVGGICQ